MKFNLNIENPCSEKFENFEPTEKGGFCNSCQKEVIDFTGMSSREILKYFKNNSGNTCGQFSKNQLEQTYQDFEKPKFRIFKNFGIAIVSLFSFNTIYAQTEKPKTEINSDRSKKIVDNPKVTISGTVYDEYLECFSGVIVRIKYTKTFTITNSEGEFTLPNPLGKNQILVFYFEGFEREEIKVTNQEDINIVLKEIYNNEIIVSGEVQSNKILKSSDKKGFWKKKKK